MSQPTLFEGQDSDPEFWSPLGIEVRERRGKMYSEDAASEAFQTLQGMLSDRLDRMITDSPRLAAKYGLSDDQVTDLLQDLQLLFFPWEYADSDFGGLNDWHGRMRKGDNLGLVPFPDSLGLGERRMEAAVDLMKEEYGAPNAGPLSAARVGWLAEVRAAAPTVRAESEAKVAKTGGAWELELARS